MLLLLLGLFHILKYLSYLHFFFIFSFLTDEIKQFDPIRISVEKKNYLVQIRILHKSKSKIKKHSTRFYYYYYY